MSRTIGLDSSSCKSNSWSGPRRDHPGQARILLPADAGLDHGTHPTTPSHPTRKSVCPAPWTRESTDGDPFIQTDHTMAGRIPEDWAACNSLKCCRSCRRRPGNTSPALSSNRPRSSSIACLHVVTICNIGHRKGLTGRVGRIPRPNRPGRIGYCKLKSTCFLPASLPAPPHTLCLWHELRTEGASGCRGIVSEQPSR